MFNVAICGLLYTKTGGIIITDMIKDYRNNNTAINLRKLSLDQKL
jgi:hypothetical protein